MTGTIFAGSADLYYVCGLKGMTPGEVDDLEMWQIAAFLGVHRPATPPGEDATGVSSSHDPVARRKARNLDLARRRIAASEGKAPKVEAAPAGLDEAATTIALSRAMRGQV